VLVDLKQLRNILSAVWAPSADLCKRIDQLATGNANTAKDGVPAWKAADIGVIFKAQNTFIFGPISLIMALVFTQCVGTILVKMGCFGCIFTHYYS
jgi:hypothetical protein